MFFVKADGPRRGGPCADEDGPVSQGAQIRQQLAADALPAPRGSDISMADERDILYIHGRIEFILFKQIIVRAGTNQHNLFSRIFINQQPIRFNMTFTSSLILSN